MSEKINQAVEEVKTVSTALNAITTICSRLEAELVAARKSWTETQDVLRLAEGKLRGVIYQETQT